MSIDYNWSIVDCRRETADGYVFLVDWSLTARDGSNKALATGNCKLARPVSPLIPYESLTEEIIVGWVKSDLGAAGVSELEGRLAATLEKKKEVADGLPWLNFEILPPPPGDE